MITKCFIYKITIIFVPLSVCFPVHTSTNLKSRFPYFKGQFLSNWNILSGPRCYKRQVLKKYTVSLMTLSQNIALRPTFFCFHSVHDVVQVSSFVNSKYCHFSFAMPVCCLCIKMCSSIKLVRTLTKFKPKL